MSITSLPGQDFELPSGWPAYAGDFVIPRFCTEGLECVIAHYAELGVPLPDRRYWTIGATARDCEQIVLTVHQMFLGTAATPTETTLCNGPRSLTFSIEVVRCVPTINNRGQPPSGAAIEAASVNPVIDLEILMDCATCFDPYNVGIVVTADVIPAEGGMQGAVASYTANL